MTALKPLDGQAGAPSAGRPFVTAFGIWFLHFMSIWAAGEIWPHQWAANASAWGLTAIALVAVGLHCMHIGARHGRGAIAGFSDRFARGAGAIAAVAVVFSALPSLVFLP